MGFTISETWALLSSLESDIKKKIEEISVPLSDLSLSIFRGVLTGFNTAFIISESKRNELVNSDPKSAEIIRPILRGRDIRRYDFSFQNLYVIFAYFGSHMVIPERYPAIYQHLKLHENKLKERGQCRYTSSGRSNDSAGYPGQHHWLELDNNPRKENLDEFSKQAFHEEEMELDTVLFDYYGFTSKERDFLRKSTKIYR